jgi:alpha-L-arabinofuranosidase
MTSWVALLTTMALAAAPDATVQVDAGKVVNRTTRLMYGSCIEDVNHEIYGGLYAQQIFGESFEEPPGAATAQGEVSGMWDAIRTGSAVAYYTWDDNVPFNSAHSQKIELLRGDGTAGVANRGLKRWGLSVLRGHAYAGRLYLRQSGYNGKVTVALQSADGSHTYASQELGPIGKEWARCDFSLKASANDANARFAVWIDKPGAVWVDQVYLSATGDELFHGLPIRADIGKMLVAEKLGVLRYGGSMVNAPEYRWKTMIGDRDRRPQYKGWWYPYSTNGFGIEDFVQFCQAAGFESVFAINMEETPEDAADLVEYLNGPATSTWGRKRAANGHPEPYGIRYIEIGNEEKTDAHYIERFKLLAEAMHARDPKMRLIIAAWWEPDNAVCKRIVAELDGKAALWDVHVGGDDLREGANVDRLFTRMRKLVQEWAPGTKLKACVLEENGGRHDLRRALGHAHILNATQRHGDFVLLDCPANCLQAWKQNDNDWDQGQLFYTNRQVWGMPPYYAQQMAAENHQPCRVASTVESPNDDLDVTILRSEDENMLIIKVVNVGDKAHRTAVQIEHFGRVVSAAEVWSLGGKLDDVNSPEEPERVKTVRSTFEGAAEKFVYEFPAYSYTILKLARRP